MSWRRIGKQALLLLHGQSLAEHGGGEGLRDDALLESALARPLHCLAYGQPDVAAFPAKLVSVEALLSKKPVPSLFKVDAKIPYH